jgi:hypothetical protein
MNHQPAPSQPPRILRTLARPGGLAACLATAIGLGPAAWATTAPPIPSFAPVPPLPPPAAVPAHFPPWAIAAILAATIVLSIATTLITLALDYTRWTRRQAAAIQNPTTAHQAEILRAGFRQQRDQSDGPAGRPRAATRGADAARECAQAFPRALPSGPDGNPDRPHPAVRGQPGQPGRPDRPDPGGASCRPGWPKGSD